MKKRTERNRPVTTLMKDFSGQDRQKKAKARKELHRRFEYLDYSQQIKILLVHLDSISNDRQWAYTRLIDYWEPCFMAPVLKLWETYHETRCSWSLVQHFPKEYIIKHLDELAYIQRNYYYICIRFGRDEDFSIDKTKLVPFDLIRVAYKTGMPISYEEVMKCFYSIIEQACNDDNFTSNYIDNYIVLNLGSDRFTRFWKNNIAVLDYAYYYVSKMNMTSVIDDFNAWMEKVNTVLNLDEEWIKLGKEKHNDWSFNVNAEPILKTILMNLIPPKYRIKNFELKTFNYFEPVDAIPYMPSKRKETLDDLIDKFNLELDDVPF